MLIDGKEYNCNYIGKIENGNIICKDGDECICQWQVSNNLYHDCEVAEYFIMKE